MKKLDVIQVIFWCLTYILVLFYQLRKKKQIIPSLVVIQNLSWEFNSVLFSRCFNYALLFRFLWLMLDFFIFMTILKMTIKISALKQIRSLLFLTVLFIPVFLYGDNLILSFVIDAVIAFCWLLDLVRSKNSNTCLVFVGFSKFFGDYFAWLAYRSTSFFVHLIGYFVLILNVAFIGVSVYRLISLRKS